jgi:hypothetical protein
VLPTNNNHTDSDLEICEATIHVLFVVASKIMVPWISISPWHSYLKATQWRIHELYLLFWLFTFSFNINHASATKNISTLSTEPLDGSLSTLLHIVPLHSTGCSWYYSQNIDSLFLMMRTLRKYCKRTCFIQQNTSLTHTDRLIIFDRVPISCSSTLKTRKVLEVSYFESKLTFFCYTQWLV